MPLRHTDPAGPEGDTPCSTPCRSPTEARDAVGSFAILGPKNNPPFFAELLDYPEFVTGRYDTGIVGRMRG